MLGQARPASESTSSRTLWLLALGTGLLLGGATSLAAADVLGRTLRLGDQSNFFLLGMLMVGFLLFDLHALAVNRLSQLGLRRQTPRELARMLRPAPCALVWGADIGTGVSTFRATSAIWLALALVAFDQIDVLIAMGYVAGSTAAVMTFALLRDNRLDVLQLEKAISLRRPLQASYVAMVVLAGLVAL